MVRDPLSVVVSTYEWPEALDAVLRALSEQSDTRFDIVVADDGSGLETRSGRRALACGARRPGRARLAPAQGLSCRRSRATAAHSPPAATTSCSWTGTRCRGVISCERSRRASVPAGSSPAASSSSRLTLTERVLAANDPIHHHGFYSWFRARRDASPVSSLSFRDRRRVGTHGVPEFEPHNRAYGFLLGVARRDFQQVNGFDTRYEGWGDEDVDFALRLRRLGLRCGHSGAGRRRPAPLAPATREAKPAELVAASRRRAASTSRPCAASASSSWPHRRSGLGRVLKSQMLGPRDGRSSVVVLVAALTAIGAALRFATLDRQSFWLDELVTVSLLRMDFDDLLRAIPESEATPYLYYVLAWPWSRLFGFGEVGLRSLSALAGAAIVPVAYGAGTVLVSRRTGLVAAALVSVHPFLVWYSQEARAYGLFALLAAVGLFFFGQALRAGGRWAFVGWAIASSLALATHYFAVFLIVPEAVWLLLRSPARRVALLATVLPSVVLLVHLPLALDQRGSG